MTDELINKLCGPDIKKHRQLHRSKLEPAFIAGQVFVIRLPTSPSPDDPSEADRSGRIGCVVTTSRPGKERWEVARKQWESTAHDAVLPSSRQWDNQVQPPPRPGGEAWHRRFCGTLKSWRGTQERS
ncbi:hypothetical protein I316_00349 [Kwoniella heveanensis BCC8398]|uniref:Uncharacterized protein n=1 Tax=Kwoniella heveanensis BCC8398 TaxID=1296120 RepID=A0A1B9H4C9_9TREE|nr:hypothetical protein I316_00349 [Kwoniella heveanensis BCC8398]